jgi:hypothetical protein
MKIGDRTASRPAGWVGAHRAPRSGPPGVAIFRSLLLSATVFALAVLTGAVLAGAAPADPTPRVDAAARPPQAREAPGAGDPTELERAERRPAGEALFARSMVYSGTVGLTLSVAGLVMVARRRRYW